MTDFTLPAHVCKLWLVRVTDTAGQVLPPGGFDLYGCAMAPGGRAVAMVAEVRGDATELVLPGLCAPGAWDLSIFCREVATGVTWAVQQGRVNVTPAPVLAGVAPAREELVAVLDRVTQELRVELGDSTASAAENARLAVAAREGADEAAERAAADAARVEELKRVTLDVAAGAALAAERAEDSKRGAQAAAGAAADDARVAEGKAAEAEASRVAAEAAQRQAEAKAAEAEAGAKVATEAVSDALAARDEAVAAQRGAVAAQVVAEDASAQAGRYAAQAVGAADGAVVAAEEAKAAEAGAVGAADGAVVAAAEAKAAEAGAAGAADAVRYDFLPMTLEWLDSRFTKNLGEGNFSMTYTDAENTLRVAFALETTAAQIVESRALLDRVLPRNLVKEISDVPMGFTRVEHIENASTAYILTDLTMSGDYDVYADFVNMDIDKNQHALIGTSVNLNPPLYILGTWNKSQAMLFYGAGRINQIVDHEGLAIGKRWIYNVRKNEVAVSIPELGINKSYAVDYENFVVERKTYLFCLGPNYWTFKCKLYSLRGSENGVPKFDLVPALDPTGAPCMFDLVSRKPFYNFGTGDFIYPGKEEEAPAAATYSLRAPRPYRPEYAKDTGRGIARLYRVPAGYDGSIEEYAAANGYKWLVENPMPEEGNWQPVWRETEEELVLEWEEVSD